MVARHDGRCWVCKAQPATTVDHDHVTGRVRGALCRVCNMVLHYVERPGWWDAAKRYLGRSRRLAPPATPVRGVPGARRCGAGPHLGVVVGNPAGEPARPNLGGKPVELPGAHHLPRFLRGPIFLGPIVFGPIVLGSIFFPGPHFFLPATHSASLRSYVDFQTMWTSMVRWAYEPPSPGIRRGSVGHHTDCT